MQSDTFEKVCGAIDAGRVHVSEHGSDEAVADGLPVVAVIEETLRRGHRRLPGGSERAELPGAAGGG